MKFTRGFDASDRYRYDFGKCSYAEGWAQLDTGQDASYFGTWVNPTTFKIFQYVEGDCYLTECDNAAELAGEVEKIKQWNLQQGWRFLGIDYGRKDGTVHKALIEAGLEQYFHGWDKLAEAT